MTEQTKPLNLIDEVKRLQTMYTSDRSQDTYNALVLGNIGIGKTSLIKTVRFPVLVDSFDPGGLKLADIQPLIEQGKIIPDVRWERPQEHGFKEWEHVFEERKRNGIFGQVATYWVDSATTFIQSILRGVIGAKNHRFVDGATQPEYKVIGNTFIDYVMLMTGLPCDFIMTGHTVLEVDQSEGKTIARFNSIPSLQINIPALFDEIYILMGGTETSAGLQRKMLTQGTDKYIARTRIGSGIFSMYEEPDIKKLLKKANLPTEDKT
jgi:hypothetical protein